MIFFFNYCQHLFLFGKHLMTHYFVLSYSLANIKWSEEHREEKKKKKPEGMQSNKKYS